MWRLYHQAFSAALEQGNHPETAVVYAYEAMNRYGILRGWLVPTEPGA